MYGCHSVTWGALGEGLPDQVTLEQSPKGRELALPAVERASAKALRQKVADLARKKDWRGLDLKDL